MSMGDTSRLFISFTSMLRFRVLFIYIYIYMQALVAYVFYIKINGGFVGKAQRKSSNQCDLFPV